MSKRTLLMAVLCLGLAAPAAYAANASGSKSRPAGINAREHRQTARIKDGVKNKELTRGELDKLRADEAALRARERVFRESGQGLNSDEYRALQRELDRLSKEISRASHNGK